MRPKKFRHGMTLVEILFSMGISAFIMYAVIGLLANTLIHRQLYGDIFSEYQKKSRVLSIIESRITNAGLGVPSYKKVENIFSAFGASILPGWSDVLEILTVNDIPVNFQDVGGEQVARGERMRVLSTFTAASDVRIIPSDPEFSLAPGEIRSVDIAKTKNKIFAYDIEPNALSSWITMPFGSPVMVRSITAPYASSAGSIELQNPLSVSMDLRGIDMFHTFRVSYFHAEAGTFYIRDSIEKDTTNAAVSVSLHKEPVADDVLSACFELNKTAKTLSCWFLIRGSGPSAAGILQAGIPREWPSWAAVQSEARRDKVKVVTHSWHLRNI